MNKFFPLVLVFSVLFAACAHVPTKTSMSSQDSHDDLANVLRELGAINEGTQPDGSAVACEDSKGWNGNFSSASTLARINAKAMIVEAGQIHLKRSKSANKVETKSLSSGIMRDNSLIRKQGKRWVCVKATSKSVYSY